MDAEPVGIQEFLDAAPDWRLLSDGATAFFPTGTLAESVRFVEAVSRIDGVEGYPRPWTSARTG